MSELKAYIGPAPDGTGLAEYYLKSEADKVIAEKDAAIAELKAENAQLKKEMEFMHSNCKWDAGDGCARLLGEKLAIIDEIVELKHKLSEKDAEIESLKASHYAEMVDAGMRERRLRRALYKACSNWACAKMEYEQFDSNMYMCGFITDKEVSWESMMKKCLKKAEEFR